MTGVSRLPSTLVDWRPTTSCMRLWTVVGLHRPECSLCMIPLVMANEPGTAHRVTAGHFGLAECRVWESLIGSRTASQSPTWQWPLPIEGDRSVRRPSVSADFSLESGCLGVQPKVRGKLLVRLNTTPRPIANKYREFKSYLKPMQVHWCKCTQGIELMFVKELGKIILCLRSKGWLWIF